MNISFLFYPRTMCWHHPHPLPRKMGLKGFIPFSPLEMISLFVPVPFPGMPNIWFLHQPNCTSLYHTTILYNTAAVECIPNKNIMHTAPSTVCKFKLANENVPLYTRYIAKSIKTNTAYPLSICTWHLQVSSFEISNLMSLFQAWTLQASASRKIQFIKLYPPIHLH